MIVVIEVVGNESNAKVGECLCVDCNHNMRDRLACFYYELYSSIICALLSRIHSEGALDLWYL